MIGRASQTHDMPATFRARLRVTIGARIEQRESVRHMDTRSLRNGFMNERGDRGEKSSSRVNPEIRRLRRSGENVKPC